MGYSSRATGIITITPPLAMNDIVESPYLPGRVNRDRTNPVTGEAYQCYDEVIVDAPGVAS